MSQQLVEAIQSLEQTVNALIKATKTPERAAWSVTETAQKLGVPKSTVRRLIHSGQLGHQRAGTYYLVPDIELRRYLARGVTSDG